MTRFFWLLTPPPPILPSCQELHITALLFGALVQHQLVSSITLGVALRYVLDALKRPPGSKMFGFGVDALRQFAPSVHLWPPFCAQVLQVWTGQKARVCRQGWPEAAMGGGPMAEEKLRSV